MVENSMYSITIYYVLRCQFSNTTSVFKDGTLITFRRNERELKSYRAQQDVCIMVSEDLWSVSLSGEEHKVRVERFF